VELLKKLSEPKPEKGGGKKASAKNEAKAAKPKKRGKKL
jgi:hypothetical protein